MKFLKKKISCGKDILCEIECDGTVTFNEKASTEQLKWLIGVLLREAEYNRQCLVKLSKEEAENAMEVLKKLNKTSAQEYLLELMRESQEIYGNYKES